MLVSKMIVVAGSPVTPPVFETLVSKTVPPSFCATTYRKLTILSVLSHNFMLQRVILLQTLSESTDQQNKEGEGRGGREGVSTSYKSDMPKSYCISAHI